MTTKSLVQGSLGKGHIGMNSLNICRSSNFGAEVWSAVPIHANNYPAPTMCQALGFTLWRPGWVSYHCRSQQCGDGNPGDKKWQYMINRNGTGKNVTFTIDMDYHPWNELETISERASFELCDGWKGTHGKQYSQGKTCGRRYFRRTEMTAGKVSRPGCKIIWKVCWKNGWHQQDLVNGAGWKMSLVLNKLNIKCLYAIMKGHL